MLRQLAAIGLASSVAAVQSVNPISVECNDDNTIDVSIDYDQKAEILGFEYGSCTKDNKGRANLTQHSDFGWKFTLDVDLCNMNDKLRTLEYNQTMSVRVGKKSQSMELTLANFQIDSYCTYTSAYKVKFDYGSLEAETISFSSDAGLVNLTFALKSYNANFSAEETNSKQAGQIVNLGLTVTSDKFDHAKDIASSKTGKVFAPKKCEVYDDNNQMYTMFDFEADDCQNKDIDFSIAFSQDKNMWQFSHILFLLGDFRKSKLSLSCDVIVCDKQKSADCDAVVKACLKPVDAVKTWGEWSNCTAECGGGNKTRTATCSGPTFFGAACGGVLQETEVCNNQTCDCVDKGAKWTFTYKDSYGDTFSIKGCYGLFYEMTQLDGRERVSHSMVADAVMDACQNKTLNTLNTAMVPLKHQVTNIYDDKGNTYFTSDTKFVDACQFFCVDGVWDSISFMSAFTPVNPSGCIYRV